MKQLVFLALVVGVTVVYGYLTFERNKIWQSNLTLWADAAAKSPESSLAHYNLGKSYADARNLDKAKFHYQQAIAKNPTYTKPYNNLGAIYAKIGRYDLSESQYKKAISLDPRFYQVYYNLGNAYMFQKKVSQAVEAYEKALSINPNYVKALSNLGVAYYEQGELEKARSLFEKALKLKPDYVPAQKNLRKLASGEKVDVVEQEGEEVISGEWQLYRSGLGVTFRYPVSWHVAQEREKIVIQNEQKTFTITFQTIEPLGNRSLQDYVAKRADTHGRLTNQGLADIPSVESAFVRVWDDEGVSKHQFFLFTKERGIEVMVWPSDTSQMKIFDQIVNSVQL